jgi:hypothetical protein
MCGDERKAGCTRRPKVPTQIQCPNPSCGRTSHLGEDPLGRIFRCPRCLAKLPTTGATAVDSGWTAVLGHLPRRSRAAIAAGGRDSSRSPGFISPARASAGFESAEFFVDAFDTPSHHTWNARFGVPLGSNESGEIRIDPFDLDEPSICEDPAECPSGPDSGHEHECMNAGRAMASLSRGVAEPAADRAALGRFRITDVLGEGKHATVYRAYDPLLERQVALKLPRREVASTPRAMERFLGEARALARLHHPRIVPIYEAGRCGGQYYIAMALIEGRSLAEALDEEAPSCRRGAEIATGLAEALAYAHGLGIVHRDVKPANVRVDTEGGVYLMDFGIAYRPDSGEMPTPPGKILGTPAYVAPEQARGGQADVLPASDQYSLGAVLYELLCGRPPFFGPAAYVLVHTLHHDPPPLRELAPEVPRSLAAICRKAMDKQPDRRYASCHALGDDLRRWLRGETPLAYRRGWAGLIG